jgi:hypothetical protein
MTKKDNKKKLPGHLGGHGWKTHLDYGLIEHMISEYNISSCLDVGCGPGGMVDLMTSKRINCVGVDGDFLLERKNPERFILHDFTKGKVSLEKKYDWAYSCEFLEHVEEKYIENFMPAFQQCRFITVTHATPGMPGHHHVNLQHEHYWIKVFAEWNLEYDEEKTKIVRQVSTMNLDMNPRKQFMKNTGMFFINTKV